MTTTTQARPPDWWKPRPTPKRQCRRRKPTRAAVRLVKQPPAMPTFVALAEPAEAETGPGLRGGTQKSRGEIERSPLYFSASFGLVIHWPLREGDNALFEGCDKL